MMRIYDAERAAGVKDKKALKRAREATKDWAVSASAFERARAASKRSVSDEDLADYEAMRREIMSEAAGGSGAASGDHYVPAVPVPSLAIAAAAASATSAGGDSDLYE
jgi:hypothetical protein